MCRDLLADTIEILENHDWFSYTCETTDCSPETHTIDSEANTKRKTELHWLNALCTAGSVGYIVWRFTWIIVVSKIVTWDRWQFRIDISLFDSICKQISATNTAKLLFCWTSDAVQKLACWILASNGGKESRHRELKCLFSYVCNYVWVSTHNAVDWFFCKCNRFEQRSQSMLSNFSR